MCNISCKKDEETPIVPDVTHTTKYAISGTGSVNYSIIYKDSTGALISLNNISSGWNKSFKSKSGDTLYLSATNTNVNGTVYGSISIDNAIVADSAGAAFPHIDISTVVP
jgi:hypothetical protein